MFSLRHQDGNCKVHQSVSASTKGSSLCAVDVWWPGDSNEMFADVDQQLNGRKGNEASRDQADSHLILGKAVTLCYQ